MGKKLGHTQGGSHRRKKIDKLKMRNYYAKDLQNFTPKIIPDKRTKLRVSDLSKAEMLAMDLDQLKSEGVWYKDPWSA